ncbi:MAG: hypothetical protein WBB85_19240 [Albidovulum sp.]|uniref:hypothetical protein n=1 Tax=Albidovulum sp. TaxID=1872424 RepID=UPI003CC05065
MQAIRGKDRPALVLRTDIANIYGTALPPVLFSELVEGPVEQAVRLAKTLLRTRALLGQGADRALGLGQYAARTPFLLASDQRSVYQDG